MIIAGIGFTSRATASELYDAVCATLEHHALTPDDLNLLATLDTKRGSQSFTSCAAQLKIPTKFIEHAQLQSASKHLITQSHRSLAATGIASVCEAAALAAADPAGRLLGARTIFGPVTCALAITERAF